MKKIRSSAIIVTYNPEIDTLVIIRKLLKQDIDLIIVDNGSNPEHEFLNEMCQIKSVSPNLYFIRNKNNVGLGEAQNIGIKKAISVASDFVFFFDQDTLIPDNYINEMKKSFVLCEEKLGDSKLGILAPNYRDKNIGDYAHFAKLTEHSFEDLSFKEEMFLEVSFVISSGSMMRLETLKKNGFFLKGFFIDQIDTEYCLRLLRNGFKIVATSNVLLIHTIGNREKKKFLNLVIKPNHHSDKRKYTIFRNGIIVLKEYKSDFPGFLTLIFKRFVHDILGVVLFEDKKVSKLIMITKGIKDGILTKYDEYK